MKGSKGKAETKKADSRLSVKKGAAAAKPAKKPAKKEKAPKDPNRPKRPASAFFVFMEDFRQQFKEKHPNNKAVSVVGKAGGEKWKSMSEAEKAPYVAKAEKRKIEFEKSMKAYEKKQAEVIKPDEDLDEEGSEKSVSEVHDDDDDEDDSGEEDDDEE